MTFHSVPSTPSASSETVTFVLTASEFALLATFMAPLGIDESAGESVWVIGDSNGTRQWIATGGQVTAMVNESGLDDFPMASPWAYPIPEHALVLLGRLFATIDSVTLTISDDQVRIISDRHDVVIAQIQRLRVPPAPPLTRSAVAVTVSAAELFTMMSAATAWPGGGVPPEREPVITYSFDIEHQQLVISPDWGDATLGYASYRLATSFVTTTTNGTDDHFFAPFNVLHTAMMHSLRDPAHAARIGEITVHQPTRDTGQHCLTGSRWILQLPIVPDVSPWGHDLEDVLGNTSYFWVDPQRVRLTPANLSPGWIDLEALAPLPADPAQRYRLTYDILPAVVPTLDLFHEINDANRQACGYQVLIDGSRLIARRDLTHDEYVDLDHHVKMFVNGVSGLSALYEAWAF